MENKKEKEDFKKWFDKIQRRRGSEDEERKRREERKEKGVKIIMKASLYHF